MTRMECMNCDRLGNCKETNAQRLLNAYFCDRWSETSEAERKARADTLSRYGPAAAQALVTLKEDE